MIRATVACAGEGWTASIALLLALQMYAISSWHQDHVLRRRAELAETAFIDLADILSSAPDPTPLLSNAGSLKATIDGMKSCPPDPAVS